MIIYNSTHKSVSVSIKPVFTEPPGPSGPHSGPLYRIVLPKDLVCNDGTEAVYYRSYAPADSPNADKWIIEFEGGGSCGAAEACALRWEERPQDMTTKSEQEEYFDLDGGLINEYEMYNPHFWNYNRVRAHYCSSDSWLGQQDYRNTGGFAYLGAKIALGIVDDLMLDPAFKSSSVFLFTGISVGGVGILNLADYIDERFATTAGFNAKERYFISDCGWDLADWACYGDDCATDGPSGSLTLYRAHNPLLNAGCLAAGMTWQCYWPEYMYKYILAAPKFLIAQQMYDSQQLPWTGKLQPGKWDDDKMAWALARTEVLLASFAEMKVTNLFSSNCRSHGQCFTIAALFVYLSVLFRSMSDLFNLGLTVFLSVL
jgi:hypothetical protein